MLDTRPTDTRPTDAGPPDHAALRARHRELMEQLRHAAWFPETHERRRQLLRRLAEVEDELDRPGTV